MEATSYPDERESSQILCELLQKQKRAALRTPKNRAAAPRGRKRLKQSGRPEGPPAALKFRR
jgi:hypothetical protein